MNHDYYCECFFLCCDTIITFRFVENTKNTENTQEQGQCRRLVLVKKMFSPVLQPGECGVFLRKRSHNVAVILSQLSIESKWHEEAMILNVVEKITNSENTIFIHVVAQKFYLTL